MNELSRVLDELEQLLDEIILSGTGAVSPSFFSEMKQECERYGLSYAAQQLQRMEEEQHMSRFRHHEDNSIWTEAFCKLHEYVVLLRLEMLAL